MVKYFGMTKIMNEPHCMNSHHSINLAWTPGVCMHFDNETLVDGQGTCMLWDDAPFKCIGWLSNKACCIDYETWVCYGLEKS